MTRAPPTHRIPPISGHALTRYWPGAGCWSTARTKTDSRPQPARADIVVLDVEDAVAPKEKSAARDKVIRWLDAGNVDWVRINGFGTPWWADDLDMLANTPVGGVMLAIVESVDHVTETARRLPNLPIVALVETARGLERITEIAAATGTSGSPSASAISAATPVLERNRPPPPTRAHASQLPPRRLTCRV
jgi:citrate lyase beta subunit